MYARVILRLGVIEQDKNMAECILNSIHLHIVVPVSVSVYMIICIYLCVRVISHFGVIETGENMGECMLNGIQIQNTLPLSLFV